jgi:hypothetical protein
VGTKRTGILMDQWESVQKAFLHVSVKVSIKEKSQGSPWNKPLLQNL